jgi:hypothetical protein
VTSYCDVIILNAIIIIYCAMCFVHYMNRQFSQTYLWLLLSLICFFTTFCLPYLTLYNRTFNCETGYSSISRYSQFMWGQVSTFLHQKEFIICTLSQWCRPYVNIPGSTRSKPYHYDEASFSPWTGLQCLFKPDWCLDKR